MTSATGETGVMGMNRFKVHFVVERIKLAGEFPFNIEDVESDLEAILAFFGIDAAFLPAELVLLRGELHKLALAEEFEEAAQLATADPLEAMVN